MKEKEDLLEQLRIAADAANAQAKHMKFFRSQLKTV